MISINIAIDNAGKNVEQISNELTEKLTEAIARVITENGLTGIDAVKLASSLLLGASGIMSLAISPDFTVDALKRLAEVVNSPESRRNLGFPLAN